MTHNLREASKNGIPTPREGYEQRKVLYKKYNEAVIKGWSKRVDDNGQDYTDKDFVLCERKLPEYLNLLDCLPKIKEAFDKGFSSISEEFLTNGFTDAEEIKSTAFVDFASVEFSPIKPEDIHGVYISGTNGSVILEKNNDGVFVETSPDTKKKRVRKPTL